LGYGEGRQGKSESEKGDDNLFHEKPREPPTSSQKLKLDIYLDSAEL
jgi:hypothetical protein